MAPYQGCGVIFLRAISEIAVDWAFLKKNIEKAQSDALKLQDIAVDWERNKNMHNNSVRLYCLTS